MCWCERLAQICFCAYTAPNRIYIDIRLKNWNEPTDKADPYFLLYDYFACRKETCTPIGASN